MRSRAPGSCCHVVPWLNKAEWDHVVELLYSSDAALQKVALQRISAWKARFGKATPVAVESTAELVRCQVLDSSGQLDPDDMVLLYGTALVRFVNLITERRQKRISTSLRRLAGKMNIPEWIVNLRHEITHRNLPTLKWCRRGCKFVLEWLQQEYWSRQLGRQLDEHWDSQSENDEEEGESEDSVEEDELVRRKRKMLNEKKARELLISYENEQFQAFDKLHKENKKLWSVPSTDLTWILIQIKDFALESSDALVDVLLTDGFMVPTVEQLEALDIKPADSADPTEPRVPRLFLRFWQPLLKTLSTHTFIQLFLEKLFGELQLSRELSHHRMYYLAGWISEVFSCCSHTFIFFHKNPDTNKSKAQRKARLRDNVVPKFCRLPWEQLLSICLDAPCMASPYLLQQILKNMEPPLPMNTQQKLLQLCSIYTQGGLCDLTCSPPTKRLEQPIYTLESLQRAVRPESRADNDTQHPGGLSHSLQTRFTTLATQGNTEDLQEHLSEDILIERAFFLRGSPWQVCTDNVKWKDYPLGKVPGQSEDPSYLTAENFSIMSVLDQQIEVDKPALNSTFTSASGPSRCAADGLLWTHSDLSKLKSGLQLF
ncbi:ribosomal biogenesis protein LAS1L [Arapaima gigas]